MPPNLAGGRRLGALRTFAKGFHPVPQFLILAAKTATSSGSSSLFLIVILVVLAGFMFMRPGRKRARQQQELMRKQVLPGAEVRTNAGLYATVSEVSDQFVTLEVAPGVFSRYDPRAVAAVVNQAPDSEFGAPGADAAFPYMAAPDAAAPDAPSPDTASGEPQVDASVAGAAADGPGGEAADTRRP